MRACRHVQTGAPHSSHDMLNDCLLAMQSSKSSVAIRKRCRLWSTMPCMHSSGPAHLRQGGGVLSADKVRAEEELWRQEALVLHAAGHVGALPGAPEAVALGVLPWLRIPPLELLCAPAKGGLSTPQPQGMTSIWSAPTRLGNNIARLLRAPTMHTVMRCMIAQGRELLHRTSLSQRAAQHFQDS
jgi:hypothetical protein